MLSPSTGLEIQKNDLVSRSQLGRRNLIAAVVAIHFTNTIIEPLESSYNSNA